MEKTHSVHDIIGENNEVHYKENLLKSDKYSLSFKVEILSKRKTCFKSTMSIDNQNREIIFTTDKDDLIIKISFADVLGFIPISESLTADIKKSLANGEQVLLGRFLAQLNFFPKITKRKCTCCGWMCCKCKETITERRPKDIEMLVYQEEMEAITLEFNKICMRESVIILKELDYKKKRKFLLFVNPIGGRGVAWGIWNQVRNIFDLSNIEVEVFRTQYYRHAYEHTLKMDFQNYDGVLCCSGDGIVHEVINGIFHREDSEEFIHSVPIGVIPGGTSNGYAKVLCEASKEVCTPENCAYIISKGQVKEVDILEIESLSQEKKIYSFLCLAWGLIADIDLESEACRCCGPMRYTMYGAFRWICLRNAYAALYYLPQEVSLNSDEIPSLRHPLTSEFIRENEQFYYFWACNVPWTDESIHSAPKAELDDGFCDLLQMNSSAGKCNLLKQLFNQDSGDYFDNNGEFNTNSGLKYIKTKCWRLIPKSQLTDNDDPQENRNLPRFYAIDGERYPIGPIQVKTLRKVLRVFCL